MTDPVRPAAFDYEEIAEHLGALAYAVRLAILDALAIPRTLSDIRVQPLRTGTEGGSERPAAKQTVLAHLEKLVEAGLVVTGSTQQRGKTLTTYAVNPQRLYALTEDLRELGLRHAGRGQGVEDTMVRAPGEPAGAASEPRLVLVHGLRPGRVFPLRPEAAVGGAWTIGRRRDVAVPLDHDPFVSQENTAIQTAGDRYVILDLPTSRNGTQLNWRELPPEAPQPLARGDVIGVGRSLLVFYDA